MHTFYKALGLTTFFFAMVAGVVFLANFRLNLYHDAYYESPATTSEIAPRLDTTRFWLNLYRWDAGWYWDLATKGYRPENATFFPLYPTVVRGLMYLQAPGPNNFSNAALIVSVLGVFGITALLITLAKHDGHTDPTYAALLFLFFPSAMFLAAPYTEALFICLLLAYVYALKHRKWWVCLLLGIGLGLTRVTGVMIILYPLYLWWRNRSTNLWRLYTTVTLGPLIGVAILAVIQHYTLHHALAFIANQNNWGRTTTLNPATLWSNYAQNWRDFMSLSLFHPRFIGWAFTYLFAALGLGLTTWLWFVKREYAVISAAMIALPLLSGTTHSFPRLVLPAIPFAALVIAEKIKNPTARALLLIGCVAGWIFFLILFTRGYWVA